MPVYYLSFSVPMGPLQLWSKLDFDFVQKL